MDNPNVKKMLYTDNSKCNFICGFDDEPNLDKDKQKQISYLSVKSVEEGIDWYRNEFPKMNEELLPLLSRWNFGDLNFETKKSIKNKRKKDKKKEKPFFKIEHRPVIITFN